MRPFKDKIKLSCKKDILNKSPKYRLPELTGDYVISSNGSFALYITEEEKKSIEASSLYWQNILGRTR